jgi:hypothetical protein
MMVWNLDYKDYKIYMIVENFIQVFSDFTHLITRSIFL